MARPKNRTKAGIQLDVKRVEAVAKLLADKGIDPKFAKAVQEVMLADEIYVRAITSVLELTPAIVKTLYENNSNTNAFTDALVTKINGVEANATADQTGAEILALLEGLAAYDIDSLSDVDTTTAAPNDGDVLTWDNSSSRWEPAAPTGGGGTGTSDFNTLVGGVTFTGELAGAGAVTITNPAAGEYLVVVPSGVRLLWLNAFANNSNLNGSNEFILRVDHSADAVNRRYTVQQFARTNGARSNVFSIGTNETQTITSNVTQILFPGMNGYGSSGFDLALS